MKITDVKVFPVDEDKLKAYATITFDNCFIVRDLKVISGNKGYFIAMPSKKRKDGTFRDVAHPLNSETRKMIEDAVLKVYEEENETGTAPRAYDADDREEAAAYAAQDEPAAEAAVPEPPEAPADEESVPGSASEDEEPSKGAEENPTIVPTDDPEKAFGYEE